MENQVVNDIIIRMPDVTYKVIEDFFPKHMSLHIQHNAHKDCCLTVKKYLEEYPHLEGYDPDIVNRCIESDSIWEIKWYAITPVSFYVVIGSTLQEALNQIEEK